MAFENWYGFQYRGKDKRGVSRWRGRGWNNILKWLGIGFLVYACLAGVAFLGMLLYALLTLSWPIAFHALVFVAGGHALVFGGIGAWALHMRRHILALSPAQEICTRFGVNEETLGEVAMEKGIKPRLSINGLDYYNPADFAEDAFILLRGTTRPAEAQTELLRPATTQSPTAPEELLRSAEDTSLPATHALSTYRISQTQDTKQELHLP